MKTYNELVELFEQSNSMLLDTDMDLFMSNVSERTLCGALMLHLHDSIKKKREYKDYYVDVEYNRNRGSVKTVCKTVRGNEYRILRINCDLILHSRGKHFEQDNLIAIEMKKSTRPKVEKDKDRERLMALTKDSFDDVWSFDGRTLPEHVCRYVLGVYYEINYRKKEIQIEYYQKGILQKKYTVLFC